MFLQVGFDTLQTLHEQRSISPTCQPFSSHENRPMQRVAHYQVKTTIGLRHDMLSKAILETEKIHFNVKERV